MNMRLTQLIRTAMVATLTMGFLAACEKGVFMKDTKITTPDFKITTQQPAAVAETPAQYEIDLKSLIVSDDAITEGAVSWTGLLDFTVTNKTLKQEKRVSLSAKALQDKVTAGRVKTEANEPEITYRTKCAGTNCSKYYLVVMFHFYDDQKQLQDLRYLVIGWYRDLKQVKRTLLGHDIENVTLEKMVTIMENMDPSKTIPPVAGATAETGVTSPSGVTASTGTMPDETLPAADADVAATVTAPTGETVKTNEDVVTQPGTPAADDEEYSENDASDELAATE